MITKTANKEMVKHGETKTLQGTRQLQVKSFIYQLSPLFHSFDFCNPAATDTGWSGNRVIS